ncbi:Hypothetical predicted protein [Cloeon dipterum]|uniref:Uncharacterized protein n=1 Tax=Cloeon dipterum TaxID=197152 RepID=A0A8S1CZ13_9INSE|nr:Hypothetical predicted protein [Cloeon dipterum]
MQAATRVLSSRTCSVLQRRTFISSNVISGPPAVRIPFPEKVAHGLTITFGLLFTPAYILGNLKHYTNK